MFDVRKDLEGIYKDIGYECILPDASKVYLIQDNTLEVDDSTLKVTRGLSGHNIKRGDTVIFRGYSHHVAKVGPHDDIEYEDIIHLRKKS